MIQGNGNKQDTDKHLLDKLSVGAVSCWRYFSSGYPKWNTKIELMWNDKTEDSMIWSKPNVEQIDFDIDCRPMKWRYACS